MQPLQCDLQPQIRKHPRTTHCKTPSRNQSHTKTNTRKNTWFRAPASSPKQPHATFVQPLQCILQLQVYIHAAITLRSATTDSKTPCNYAHTTNHALQNTIKEPITHQNERTATAAHTSCPPSPPAATLHGNTHGFVLRLPPQSKPHATSTQPLQCVLQRQVANPHLSTHMATERDNNHAAIPLRSATTDSKTPYNYAHTNASKAASTHRYSVATKKHQNERPTPASHTSCPPSPAAATLHEKHKVSCSGFLPNTTPM